MKHTRIQVHRHNSFRGHCAMASQNMESIIRSVTATDEAKNLAAQVQSLVGQLDIALRTRKDPPA